MPSRNRVTRVPQLLALVLVPVLSGCDRGAADLVESATETTPPSSECDPFFDRAAANTVEDLEQMVAGCADRMPGSCLEAFGDPVAFDEECTRVACSLLPEANRFWCSGGPLGEPDTLLHHARVLMLLGLAELGPHEPERYAASVQACRTGLPHEPCPETLSDRGGADFWLESYALGMAHVEICRLRGADRCVAPQLPGERSPQQQEFRDQLMESYRRHRQGRYDEPATEK